MLKNLAIDYQGRNVEQALQRVRGGGKCCIVGGASYSSMDLTQWDLVAHEAYGRGPWDLLAASIAPTFLRQCLYLRFGMRPWWVGNRHGVVVVQIVISQRNEGNDPRSACK